MTVERFRGAPVRRLARAKVNLCLHVVGRRGDGYHLLESLVAFPAVGDLIEVEPARSLGLAIAGPFGDMLGAGPDNLVLKAATALRAQIGATEGAAIRLTKSLPVASGIGGGSADAAATLRALSTLWGRAPDEAALAALALTLGADVPACLSEAPAVWMAGVGEALSPAPTLPDCWIVLVNPGVETPTPAVFKALARKDNPVPPPPPTAFDAPSELAAWLAETRNDLEPPAIALTPVVGAARDALAAAEGALIARMSGSGATCFALFADDEAALAASARIARERPGWWTAAAPLG